MRDAIISAAKETAKRATLVAARALTLPTSKWRVLPDFLIIGAQKCGTSSLYTYLTRHPAILPAIPAPLAKEVHFFDLNHGKGPAWYRSHFPTRHHVETASRRLGVRALAGEATPYYLFHPRAPELIAATLPEVKLIVMLRDPVKRAYSHYQHEVALGFERLPFEEALEREDDRLAGEAERMLEDPTYNSFNHQHYSYLARGRYAEQLEVWYSLFPRERILVLRSEDFFADPDACFRRVLRFLGLPEISLPSYDAVGRREYPRMDDGVRRWLVEYFRDPNQRLTSLLGADFGWSS